MENVDIATNLQLRHWLRLALMALSQSLILPFLLRFKTSLFPKVESQTRKL